MAGKDKSEDEPAENTEENKEGGAEGEEGGGSKSKKKLILFIAIPVLLLIGAGAGLYFTGMLDGLLGKSEEVAEGEAEAGHGEAAAGDHGAKKDSHAKKDDHGKKKEAKGGDHGGGGGHGEAGGHGVPGANFLQIPNMLVNLNTPDGQPRYLRLSVQLEFETAEDMHAVEAVMPRVVDQFQTYLRELRIKDLRGSAGIYRLQMELLSRVNAAAYPVEVKDVLFQEILIQ